MSIDKEGVITIYILSVVQKTYSNYVCTLSIYIQLNKKIQKKKILSRELTRPHFLTGFDEFITCSSMVIINTLHWWLRCDTGYVVALRGLIFTERKTGSMISPLTPYNLLYE